MPKRKTMFRKLCDIELSRRVRLLWLNELYAKSPLPMRAFVSRENREVKNAKTRTP